MRTRADIESFDLFRFLCCTLFSGNSIGIECSCLLRATCSIIVIIELLRIVLVAYWSMFRRKILGSFVLLLLCSSGRRGSLCLPISISALTVLEDHWFHLTTLVIWESSSLQTQRRVPLPAEGEIKMIIKIRLKKKLKVFAFTNR